MKKNDRVYLVTNPQKFGTVKSINKDGTIAVVKWDGEIQGKEVLVASIRAINAGK